MPGTGLNQVRKVLEEGREKKRRNPTPVGTGKFEERMEREDRVGNPREKTSLEPSDHRMTGQNNYSIELVWDTHNEVVRRIVLGQSNVDIARDLSLTPQTISHLRNNSMIRRRIDYLSDLADGNVIDIRARQKEVAEEAQVVLERLMLEKTTPDRLRASIAMDQLDRAGYQAPKVIKSEETIVTIDMVSAIKERVKEERILRKETEVNAEVLNVETVPSE